MAIQRFMVYDQLCAIEVATAVAIAVAITLAVAFAVNSQLRSISISFLHCSVGH